MCLFLFQTHTHARAHASVSPSITAEAILLFDWCALWIMEPIWSKSLRSSGPQMGVTGFLYWEQRQESTAVIKESPEGLICILHSQLKWKRIAPAPEPSQFISDMLLIFHAAIMGSWTSMALTNFQRLWGCENHKTFSWRKNDRAFHYSFMTLGVNLRHNESAVS